MLNLTQVPAPRVPLIDSSTGLISTEWFRFFNGLYAVVGENQNVIQPVNGGTGVSATPTDGQLLIGNGTGFVLNTLTPGTNIGITNAPGAITIAIDGVLAVVNGGTGQSSYTDGQLLIGNTTGNTLGKSTLTAGSGIAITNGAASVTIASNKAYGSFYDTTTQSAAALTVTAITFNSTSLSYNVSIGSPTSRIVISTAGIYNIQFSAQVSNPSAAIDDVTIWLRKNGADISDSAGLVGVPAKHGAVDGHTIIGWNYLTQAAVNDYFELYWTTDNGTTQILTYPASAVPPIHPQAPSMILTVQQV